MSFTGLKTINATSINNQGQIRLGSDLDPGTAGQVIVSQGDELSATWGTNSAKLPNALTMGTDVFLSSGNSSFDGSIADTINAAGHGFGSGGNGIDITGTTITTDNDGTTINNTGGTGAQNQVLKVPNALTITDSAGSSVVFDGSSTKSITINDNDTTYQGGTGISIDTTTNPDTINCANIPNSALANSTISGKALGTSLSTLTITDSAGSSVVFDGSSTKSITINDNQLNLSEDNGIEITSTGGLNRTIGAKVDGTTVDFDGSNLSVKKVPNVLTKGTNISFINTTDGAVESTFDGSTPITISSTDTNTTYQGGTGISIDTTTNPDTINCANIPNTALANSTISGKALGTSLANLTFYQSDGTFVTSYNGADPPTSVVLPAAGSTYVGGKNITVDTTTNPDEINLDDDLDNIHSINFVSAAAAYGTELVGNNYPAFGYQTPMSYFNLTSTTNMIPGAVLATKVQRTTLIRSFSTSYAEYSSNFRTSFVAQSTNVMVEFRAIVRADNRLFYGGLYDYNAGSYNTDTRNRFNYNDENDQDFTVNTWWMRNLTVGNTYYISPYFRGSSTVYIYAGHGGVTDGYAPAIMRIYDGGNNVSVY